MDAFKEAWLAIDTNANGFISIEELVSYQRRMNYDDKFVVKWKKLFDKDNTGRIELDVFCDVLGLNAKELLEEAAARVELTLPPDVIHITGDMSMEMKLQIVKITKESLRDSSGMKDVPKKIKIACDRMYGQLWHVIICHGQFWSYFGHEPNMSWIFMIGKQVFIIFKTPEV